jgi:hypothetical protein
MRIAEALLGNAFSVPSGHLLSPIFGCVQSGSGCVKGTTAVSSEMLTRTGRSRPDLQPGFA